MRQATVDDLDQLVPLFDAYRQFYRAASDPELARRFLLERFQNQQSIIFLAESAAALDAGFTQLYPSYSSLSAARILILNDLFVRPEARRQKAASLLLDAAAQYARSIGAVRLTLSTEVTNAAAQALYQAHGWTSDSRFLSYNLVL